MQAMVEEHWRTLERPGQVRTFVARLWDADPLLTGTSLFMGALLLASAVGLALDSRQITGAPAWLKPAKFAVSTAIYSLTLAWVFTYLPGWTRIDTVALAILLGQAWSLLHTG